MKEIFRLFLLPLSFFFIGFGTWHTAYAVQVNFTGTLRNNPPCSISGKKGPLEVDFGEIGIQSIDGTNHAKPLTLVVACKTSLGNGVTLYLGYDGVNAAFNPQALQTSKYGLGILLSRDTGEIIEPDNSNHPITLSG